MAVVPKQGHGVRRKSTVQYGTGTGTGSSMECVVCFEPQFPRVAPCPPSFHFCPFWASATRRNPAGYHPVFHGGMEAWSPLGSPGKLPVENMFQV